MTSHPAPPLRRHDLDALRAIAMLLGIALHSALAFVDFPWLVQDTRRHDVFGLFFHATHGFRMPLFFVMSGFFTAMLWRRRGLWALVKHRFFRVFCPLLLGMITIIPVMNAVSGKAIQSAIERSGTSAIQEGEPATLWSAARDGDLEAIRAQAEDGANLHAQDTQFGVTPLSWAVLVGQNDAVEFLIEQGADVNARNRDGATALHCAAVFGRSDLVRFLLENGADANARNHQGQSPLDTTRIDMGVAQFIASLFNVTLDEELTRKGWADSAGQLSLHGTGNHSVVSPEEAGKNEVWGFLTGWPVFHHLWFLWHLCWLVAGFTVAVLLVPVLRLPPLPTGLVISPARFLWLIPLTMVAQATMDGFGPDTSASLVPMPNVLGYYAIFFGFGALYYSCDDPTGRISRGWRFILPLGLIVVFPLGLHATLVPDGWAVGLPRGVTVFLQSLYPWLMTFGLMGLFRKLLGSENRTLRYISDSSYWLYLAHLPLIIAAQMLVRDWPAPAGVKFLMICVGTSALLLLTYETLIRYTWVGALLNGRRRRPVATKAVPDLG